MNKIAEFKLSRGESARVHGLKFDSPRPRMWEGKRMDDPTLITLTQNDLDKMYQHQIDMRNYLKEAVSLLEMKGHSDYLKRWIREAREVIDRKITISLLDTTNRESGK